MACPSPQEISQAYKRAVASHDYSTALPLINLATNRDDPEAMALLGSLYILGRGVSADAETAVYWFRQSAVRGYTPGQSIWGTCLALGRGVPQDESEAAYWLYRAGCAGDKSAVEALGDLLLKRPDLIGAHFSRHAFLELNRQTHRLPAYDV